MFSVSSICCQAVVLDGSLFFYSADLLKVMQLRVPFNWRDFWRIYASAVLHVALWTGTDCFPSSLCVSFVSTFFFSWLLSWGLAIRLHNDKRVPAKESSPVEFCMPSFTGQLIQWMEVQHTSISPDTKRWLWWGIMLMDFSQIVRVAR
jgi:hypothetical protein